VFPAPFLNLKFLFMNVPIDLKSPLLIKPSAEQVFDTLNNFEQNRKTIELLNNKNKEYLKEFKIRHREYIKQIIPDKGMVYRFNKDKKDLADKSWSEYFDANGNPIINVVEYLYVVQNRFLINNGTSFRNHEDDIFPIVKAIPLDALGHSIKSIHKYGYQYKNEFRYYNSEDEVDIRIFLESCEDIKYQYIKFKRDIENKEIKKREKEEKLYQQLKSKYN
jgi:hypothetical protein